MSDEQYDEESRLWRHAVMAPHRLSIRLRASGLSYVLICEGDRTSQCHLWRDDEDDPATLTGHAECSILDWFDNDSRDFVEEGYVGPERDGLTEGRIIIHTWGEDGAQWNYEGDKPTWAE